MSPKYKRTLRTVVQIAIFAAGALPSVIALSGLSEQVPGVLASLAAATAVTHLMQAPAAQPFLKWLGLSVAEDTVG